jgi:glycosyltransferase involved in cell wall biosynthesis
MPTLTVALASYNCDRYVVEALESLAPSCIRTRTKLVVIDDCSSDRSIDLIRAVGDRFRDLDLTLEQNDCNRSLGYVRNRSIELCDTDYIVMVDADDVFHPDFCNIILNALDNNLGVDALVFNYTVFYGNDLPENAWHGDVAPFKSVSPLDILARPAFTWIKAFNTDSLKKSGVRFQPNVSRQDIFPHWAFFTQENLKIIMSPQSLVAYRQNDKSATFDNGAKLLDMFFAIELIENFVASTLSGESENLYLRWKYSVMFGTCSRIKRAHRNLALEKTKKLVKVAEYKRVRANLKLNYNDIRKRIFYKFIFNNQLFLRITFKVSESAHNILRKVKSWLI